MRPGWFGRPRLRSNDEDRRTTWLELFYDLVFVAAVAALAQRLAHEPTTAGMWKYAVLFVPVWWAWTGAAFFATRFDTDDTGQRILIAVQMLAAGSLALHVAQGLESHSGAFALSYAALRWLLVLQYARVARHLPAARPLARWYGTGFAVAAAIWTASALLPPPWRFMCWVVGLAFDFGTPLSGRHHQAALPPSGQHIPERFGLFTLIVLGESIIGIVRGVAGEEGRLSAALVAAIGLVLPFTIWWAYFDDLSGAAISRIRVAGQVWLYAHLPLAIGIAATGVGIELTLAHAPSVPLADAPRWLLSGAVALSLAAMAVIHLTAHERARFRGEVKASFRFGAAIAVLLLAWLGSELRPPVFLGAVAVMCVVQLAGEIRGAALERRTEGGS